MKVTSPFVRDFSAVESSEETEGFPAFTPVLAECVHFLHKLPATRAVSAGTILAHQAGPAVSVYLIESGLVKLVHLTASGREIAMGLRTKGWYAGYSAALLKTATPYSVVALTTCRVVRIPCVKFPRYLADHPEMLEHFLSVLCMEVAAQASLEVELMSSSAEDRLDHFMHERANHHLSRRTLDPLPLLKQQELAQLLAVTPEHLSRMIKKKKEARQRR